MATENVMMAAVAAGGDRQEVHEVIRGHSQAVTAALKDRAPRQRPARPPARRPVFAEVDFDAVLAGGQFVGRAPEQVDEFIRAEIDPVRARFPHALGRRAEVEV